MNNIDLFSRFYYGITTLPLGENSILFQIHLNLFFGNYYLLFKLFMLFCSSGGIVRSIEMEVKLDLFDPNNFGGRK